MQMLKYQAIRSAPLDTIAVICRMLATPMSAPRPLSNQRLKLHRLFPVLNGYGGVRIQGV
jgi:hypothetical protein